MPHYKLIIEFDGGPFVGWQRQKNGRSVQEAVEDAITSLSGEEANVFAAGRTDAGVHALAMTAHVALGKTFEPDVVRDGINHFLKPSPVAVLSAEVVADDFHARFSCIQRSYEYRIVNRRAPLALERGRAWQVSTSLNAETMHEAAQCLVGRHDFTTFRSTQCQSETPVKTFNEISVSRQGEEIIIRCAARSFLHHQVRSIVGSLVEVGRGKWSVRDFEKALKAKAREACGPVAPPDGLYFIRADYVAS